MPTSGTCSSGCPRIRTAASRNSSHTSGRRRPSDDILRGMNIDISQLDEAQLVELNRRIVARLRYLQEARTHRQMLSFNVGERVSFHPPGHDPKTGVIVKYN